MSICRPTDDMSISLHIRYHLTHPTVKYSRWRRGNLGLSQDKAPFEECDLHWNIILSSVLSRQPNMFHYLNSCQRGGFGPYMEQSCECVLPLRLSFISDVLPQIWLEVHTVPLKFVPPYSHITKSQTATQAS